MTKAFTFGAAKANLFAIVDEYNDRIRSKKSRVRDGYYMHNAMYECVMYVMARQKEQCSLRKAHVYAVFTTHVKAYFGSNLRNMCHNCGRTWTRATAKWAITVILQSL
jgi:hypothetical protein